MAPGWTTSLLRRTGSSCLSVTFNLLIFHVRTFYAVNTSSCISAIYLEGDNFHHCWPGCSKLSVLLLYKTAHFQMHCIQRHCPFFAEKKCENFAGQKNLFIQQKEVRNCFYVNRRFNKILTNNFLKLMML